MSYYVNENIKNTHRVFPVQGRYDFHRYDMNENPEGLPQRFVDAVLKEITPEFLATYPEPGRFQKMYADFVGVSEESVLATNGSDMGIRYLLEVFGEPGKEVVTVSPSFEMYRINCSILGLRHVPVEYEPDWSLDMDKLLNAITCETCVVVLLNPNNPIGSPYTSAQFNCVAARAKEMGAIVIVDEAYHYFYANTFLKDALSWDNAAVLRTFSKLFSLAACRLGVIIGDPSLIRYVRNAKLSFDVNSIALLFGERILEHPELIEQLIREEAAGKRFILNALTERGYECRACEGNFIFVRPRNDAKIVAERLQKEKKVLVHSYGNPLLREFLRVSTGSEKTMKLFLDAFLGVDEGDCQ